MTAQGVPPVGAGDEPAVEEPSSQVRQGVSRRTVLRSIGIGGGVALLAGTGVVGVRAESNGVWSVGRGEPWRLWSTWQDAPGTSALVAAGTLAANPHNVQPWRFVVGDADLELHDDRSRMMPVSDPDGRERGVGYGCVLENVVVAARSRALVAEIRPWPDAVDRTYVARVALRPGASASAGELALAGAIAARHSNRGPYRDRPVLASTLDGLADPQGLDAAIVWVTDPAARSALGALYVEATEAIVADEEMSVEGFAWFRNDRSAVEQHRDGLTLDCQGLSPFTLAMSKILPAQSRTAGDDFWLRSTRDVHTATAAAYGVVRVADVRDPAARVDGGRLLQRVHLAATAAGLGLQHMNQITERIDRDRVLGVADRFAQRWSQVIGLPAGEGLVSFRIGVPAGAANPSPRRELAAVAA